MNIDSVIQWINDNKEWFLSGMGIAIVSILIKIIKPLVSRKTQADKQASELDTHSIIVRDSMNTSISIHNSEPASLNSINDRHLLLDNKVKKVKSFAEIETISLFQQNTITSLHLLFSLFETSIAFANRREIRKLLKINTLRQYIKDYAKAQQNKTDPERQTTKDFERIFEKATELRRDEDAKVTVNHLINAILVIRPQSISNYFDFIKLTWEEFSDVSQPTLRRGQIDSPK